MSILRIPTIKVSQNKKDIFIAKMKVEDLKKYTIVDRYDSNLDIDHPKQGYQRSAEARYKKFANYLIKSEYPYCPTAILLSARDYDLHYDQQTSTIQIDSDHKLQIVDGQHRERGYSFAIYEKNIEELIGFETPVIIMHNINKITEMRQFAIVNGTQKKVRLDLVNMILTQIAEREGVDKIKKQEFSRVVIARTVELLNNDDGSPWHNMIIMPNEKAYTKKEVLENPSLKNRKIVLATSFMTSLKPIYSYLGEFHPFLKGDPKEQARGFAEILSEFWKAIKFLVPEAFENPSGYVIQKTPGLFSLHTICRNILPRLHMARKGFLEFEFRNLLKFSSSLSNPEFWDAEEGEAAKYGSMKGFAELASIIDEELLEV